MKIISKIKKMVCNFPHNKVRIWALRSLGNKIGNDVYLGEGFMMVTDSDIPDSFLLIKDRVSIGPRVTCILASGSNNSILQNIFPLYGTTITIEQDAWIGAGVIIYPGVTIGKCSVVNAGAVVTKNVPDYSVVGGVPARIIKNIKNRF